MSGSVISGIAVLALVVTILAVGSYRGLRRVEVQAESDRAVVVAALRAAGRPLFVLDLARLLNLDAARIYVALAHLEATGAADSGWIAAGVHRPRRRAYWVAPAAERGESQS